MAFKGENERLQLYKPMSCPILEVEKPEIFGGISPHLVMFSSMSAARAVRPQGEARDPGSRWCLIFPPRRENKHIILKPPIVGTPPFSLKQQKEEQQHDVPFCCLSHLGLTCHKIGCVSKGITGDIKSHF